MNKPIVLLKLKPKYVVHGDDWQEEARQSVLQTIAAWQCEMIETDYDSSPTSSTDIKSRVFSRR